MVFEKKVFKQKIGTKTDANAVDAHKIFSNGHKCFTSAQAAAMNEQQARERKTAEVFEANQDMLYRPRNPLTGEQTPRDGTVYKEVRVDKYPLIQLNRPEFKPPREPKQTTLKPGVSEPKNGPLDELELAAHEEQKQMHRVDSIRQLQDNVSGELLFLQKRLAQSLGKVNTSLVTNFVASQRRPVPGSHHL
jgi:hypothetical protein